jgi:hypothetical protein
MQGRMSDQDDVTTKPLGSIDSPRGKLDKNGLLWAENLALFPVSILPRQAHYFNHLSSMVLRPISHTFGSIPPFDRVLLAS